MHYLDYDHEQRLQAFLDGLRNDPAWSEAQVLEMELAIRAGLDDNDGNDCETQGRNISRDSSDP